MKTRIYTLAVLFAISLMFGSCRKDKKDDNPNNDISNFLDLEVSQSFNFESFDDYSTSIKIGNTKSSGTEIIQIYDAHPAEGGKLILTGSANSEGEFELPIRLATRLEEVYVAKLSSNGMNEYIPVEVDGSKITFDFTSNSSTRDNDPCTSGCTTTADGTYNDTYTINSGEVVCVLENTSATFKKLHINSGGILRVCGNANVTKYQGGSGNGTILVNDAGTLNLPKYNTDLTIENYGLVNFSGNGTISLNGTILNYGEISSTIKMINEGNITNSGDFITSKEFTNNPGSNFINNCDFKVNKSGNNSFIQNSDFTNNGYVYVEGTANLTGSGGKVTTLGLGSLIEADDFDIEGTVVGPTSSGAQITADDDGKVTGGASITGHVDLCADDPDYNYNGIGPDVTYCDYVIVAPSCDANIPPVITSSLQIGGLVGQAITPYIFTATGTEPITYSVGTLPTGLSFDPNTNTISGSATTAGTYNVEITASNFMGTDTETLVITITQPTAPPVITSPSTDNTTVNQSYSYELTATGEPTITYTATNLPDALTFNSTTNTIEGTPTSAGTYYITLSATNAGGTTFETLALTVGTPPAITSPLTATGTAGVQLNTYTFEATENPTSYSVSGLPTGLSFDESDQTINGTPVYPATYNVTLTAANAYGTTVETLVLTINEGLQPPTITSLLAATAMKDFPFSYSITADGSVPMTFTATDLPTGLTIDGNTISGVPTVSGTYNINIGANNAAGTDAQVLVLTINTGGGSDTDGDGIPDNLDSYPTDPTRAFNSFYPNETDYGSFAFEDLWPGYGDYDFNDLVVNFNYTTVTNAQNEVVDVITKFQIMASGASQNNGFGIVFDAPSSSVGSVTGCMKFGNAVQIDPKGFEVGHTNSTVIIPFDAITTIMEGGIVNTIPGGQYVQTTVNTVTTHFEIPQASVGTPPFNPFIFIDQTRGYEVHLKNQPPTELVDPDYFDTFHDVSDPDNGVYYVSESGLPWGIEVPQNFEYPVEKADILTAYLKFAAWAQSSGTDYPDWYMNNAGYRNSANIYVIP